MIKRFLALLVVLLAWSFSAMAADANSASQADLDAVKGIGPAISSRIVAERAKGPFKDWNDLVTRVNGIGTTNAAKLSTAGLTVNGTTYAGAPAAAKPAPATATATTAKPAATATAAAPAAKATAAAPAASTAAPAPASAASKSRRSRSASAAASGASK